MTLRYGISSLALLLLLSACDESSDTGSDGGVDGGVTVVEAPTLTSPVTDDAVSGIITLTGTGEPDARIQATVANASGELGDAGTNADATGAFSFALSYTGAADTDALTLSVTQSAREMTSEATTVVLVHSTPFTISGTISQATGGTIGENVYVLAYLSDSVADIINPVAEVMVPATAGQAVDMAAYSVPVAAGTYYLRAFRDENGDGLPSIPTDPQVAATEVVVSNDVTGEELSLEFVPINERYSLPSAHALRESAEPFPPGDNEENAGLCGGFHLLMNAVGNGIANLSGLFVKTGSGNVVELLDDGGCDNNGDNTSSSYDSTASDDLVSYGIPNPTDLDAGEYRFFYQETQSGFIDIAIDNVSTIVELSPVRFQSSPSPLTATTELRPEITWTPVPGANVYGPVVSSNGGIAAVNFGTDTTFTPDSNLADDTCYRTFLDARLYENVEGPTPENLTSFTGGEGNAFCIDVDGDDSITISGAIVNNSGETGPLRIRARVGNNEVETTIPEPLPATYTLHILAADDSNEEVEVEAYIDADSSADDDTAGNTSLRAEVEAEDGTTDKAGMDLVFNPAPVLLSPEDSAKLSSLTPAFSWEDYGTTAGANAPSDYIVGFFISNDGDDFPSTIYAMPSTGTSVDLSAGAPAQSIDITYYLNCVEDPSDPENDYTISAAGIPSCQNGGVDVSPQPTASNASLLEGVDYQWGVAIFDCGFPDFTVQAEVDSFLQCFGMKLGENDIFASSERRFSTATLED